MQHTIILSPLYYDEASYRRFASEVAEISARQEDHRFSLLVVNDGTPELKLDTQLPLTIIHLHRNIGHQKAIAIGLAYAAKHLSYDRIVVMDGDGEDRPEDLMQLIVKSRTEQGIIVARRASRQEGLSFQFFYWFYKAFFYVLTGKRINFGNFMLLPAREVAKLVHYPEVWNHLAGAIIKTRLPYAAVSAHRGQRYEGWSKMNFTALLLHGLGAIGVFIEIIASRLLLFSLAMIGLSVLAIGVILFIKWFTNEAIPGWATTAFSSMLVVLLQSFLLSLFTIFLFLSFQGARPFIPAHDHDRYIREVEGGPHG